MNEKEFITLVQSKITTCSAAEAKELMLVGKALLAQGKVLSITTMELIDALEALTYSED